MLHPNVQNVATGTHAEFHFSVTVHTDDLALLGCLRALSQHAQATGNARIPWGGTKREDWKQAHHHATFHFTSALYREAFLSHAKRLLPNDLWRVTAQKDDDPASPQAA
jgi:hypothetical protein